MSPPSLPTVAPSFFHFDGLSENFVSDGDSPHFIFFDPTLKLPPYKLQRQDFVPKPKPLTPAAQITNSPLHIGKDKTVSLPEMTSDVKADTMAKAPIDPVDKNFASLKNIKSASSISDNNFAWLADSARDYVDSHKEDCVITPRLFKSEKWKNITNNFIETTDIVPKVFSKKRENCNPDTDRTWPEDKTDITFLCFTLLKFHSVKQLTPKKRKEAESGQPSSPKPKKKASSSFESTPAISTDKPEIKAKQAEDETSAEQSRVDSAEEDDEITGTENGAAPSASPKVPSSVTEEHEPQSEPGIAHGAATPPAFPGTQEVELSGDLTTTTAQNVVPVVPYGQEMPTFRTLPMTPEVANRGVTPPTTPHVSTGINNEQPGRSEKLPVITFVNGHSTGAPIVNILKPTFSSFFGTVFLNSDPKIKMDIARAARCHVRVSNPSCAEVWSIDLRRGDHEKEWIEYMKKLVNTDAKELHADFLTSSN